MVLWCEDCGGQVKFSKTSSASLCFKCSELMKLDDNAWFSLPHYTSTFNKISSFIATKTTPRIKWTTPRLTMGTLFWNFKFLFVTPSILFRYFRFAEGASLRLRGAKLMSTLSSLSNLCFSNSFMRYLFFGFTRLWKLYLQDHKSVKF